ncbi:MAG: nucleotide sugar dehydrogenase [Kiloniellales bacterium]
MQQGNDCSLAEEIGVIGLGYVGLPVALAFAAVARRTVGFDIDATRVAALRSGHDWTGEASQSALEDSRLQVTDRVEDLEGCGFFVVSVPTPVDGEKRPDLSPLRAACEIIAQVLRPGAVVVIESTVFPGATEEVCGPLLEACSGLKRGQDFHLGYSPERINPGDREHSLSQIVKIVSGEDEATLERVARAYGAIIEAGLHRAPSIKIAEAAKVIENTQRDLNIALMNELSLIFERLGIPTAAVLEAAATKWNFLSFKPGLVGGHCIGVDPYYLTSRAVQSGYQPEVILAGRRINDEMGRVVARRAVQLLARAGLSLTQARVAVLGLTFKEDVSDLRNSKVVDLVEELRAYGIAPLLHDPLADGAIVEADFGLAPVPLDAAESLDALILAVPHAAYRALGVAGLIERLKPGGLFLDLKAAFPAAAADESLVYWAL